MAIYSLFISFFKNVYGLCYVLVYFLSFVLVGLNFKFKYMQFQLAFAKPLALANFFFIAIDLESFIADLSVNFGVNLINLQKSDF